MECDMFDIIINETCLMNKNQFKHVARFGTKCIIKKIKHIISWVVTYLIETNFSMSRRLEQHV